MLQDAFQTFSDAQGSITTAGTRVVSTNVMDLGPLYSGNLVRDIGSGKPVWLYIRVDTTVLASGGAANVTFKLESAAAAALVSSPTVHWTSGPIAKATLIAGYEIKVILPPDAYQRYLGVTYTPDTNDLTAGKFDAMLVNGVSTRRDYASGFSTGT